MVAPKGAQVQAGRPICRDLRREAIRKNVANHLNRDSCIERGREEIPKKLSCTRSPTRGQRRFGGRFLSNARWRTLLCAPSRAYQKVSSIEAAPTSELCEQLRG